jgi:OOP family OmpA-OmpF porin
MFTSRIKYIVLVSPLLAVMFAGCSTMKSDKNQPPPPAAPPAEAAAPAPAPAPTPKPETIVIEGVNFDFDKDTLKSSAAPILDRAAVMIKAHPDVRFSVSGHTDSIGSDQYNEDLARRRATTVRDYLVEHGVESGRLDVQSYGETKPVADNATTDGRAKNRRVEIGPL